MGYPAIVLNDAGNEVHGFVFSSNDLAAQWGTLDEFKGEEYRRVITKAFLDDKTKIEALIYELRT